MAHPHCQTPSFTLYKNNSGVRAGTAPLARGDPGRSTFPAAPTHRPARRPTPAPPHLEIGLALVQHLVHLQAQALAGPEGAQLRVPPIIAQTLRGGPRHSRHERSEVAWKGERTSAGECSGRKCSKKGLRHDETRACRLAQKFLCPGGMLSDTPPSGPTSSSQALR